MKPVILSESTCLGLLSLKGTMRHNVNNSYNKSMPEERFGWDSCCKKRKKEIKKDEEKEEKREEKNKVKKANKEGCLCQTQYPMK